MENELRSDLALERERADLSLAGTEYREEAEGGFTISRLNIRTEASAEALGRSIGSYVTVSFPAPSLLGDGERSALTSLLSRELSSFCRKMCAEGLGGGTEILLVALGSSRLLCDSLGPAVASRMAATAHLPAFDPAWFASLGAASLRILAPGVLADSGIGAAELTKAVCERHPPALVIALDALAAREARRLLRTVQISDSGITPGSGVGGARERLDSTALGFPVLAVGVPTVIEYPSAEGGHLLVTPKEIDLELHLLAELLAHALSRTLGIPEGI